MPRPASLTAALGDDVAPLMTEIGMEQAIADTVDRRQDRYPTAAHTVVRNCVDQAYDQLAAPG